MRMTTNQVRGSGIITVGAFTMTVPATGTAALREQANTFTGALTVQGAPLTISDPSASAYPGLAISADARTYTIGVGGSGTTPFNNVLFIDDTTAGVTRVTLQPNGVLCVGAVSTSLSAGLDVTGVVRGTTFQVGSTQVLGARRTGWAAATGTATRTAFATSSVSTARLAEAVKALIDDLVAHGVIGA